MPVHDEIRYRILKLLEADPSLTQRKLTEYDVLKAEIEALQREVGADETPRQSAN